MLTGNSTEIDSNGDDKIRRVTQIFTIILALVLALAFSVHLMLTSVVDAQQQTGALINVAGKQRMLSVRIAWLSNEYVQSSDPKARGQLFDLIEQMASNQRNILFQNGEPRSLSAELQALYFQAPHRLSEGVDEYLLAAKEMLMVNEPGRSAVLNDRIQQALPTLLVRLNRAVSLIEADGYANAMLLSSVQRGMLLVTFTFLVVVALFIFRPTLQALANSVVELRLLKEQDPDTGLFTRAVFHSLASKMMVISARLKQPVSLAMLRINDYEALLINAGMVKHSKAYACAHQQVLKHFVGLLRRFIRDSDIAGRVSEQQIALVMPNTTIGGAMQLFARLRTSLAEEPVRLDSGAHFQLHLSIGLAIDAGGQVELSTLVERAEGAVELAQMRGTDHIVALDSQGRDVPAFLPGENTLA